MCAKFSDSRVAHHFSLYICLIMYDDKGTLWYLSWQEGGLFCF